MPALARPFFVPLWGLLATVAASLQALALHALYDPRLVHLPAFWVLHSAFEAGLFVAEAFAQSVLLAAIGRPVRGWTWAVGAGQVAISWAKYGLMTASIPVMVAMRNVWPDGMPLVWLAAFRTFGAGATALLIAVVVWRRRWPSSWPLWIAGRILLELPWVAALHVLPPTAYKEPLSTILPWTSAEGLYVGLGTAWLLQRWVLPSQRLQSSP